MADLGSSSSPGQPGELAAVREAWLFTRGSKSVRIVRASTRARMLLLVFGPDTDADRHEFKDVLGCLRYQAELERRLVGEGFSLDRFVAERRHGLDRRAVARGGERRRLALVAPTTDN